MTIKDKITQKSWDQEDVPANNKLHKDKLEKCKHPKFNSFYTLSITILMGLVWSLVVPGKLYGGRGIALAASDPMIAAASGIACDPTNANFNPGNGNVNNCHEKYTSNLLVNAGFAVILSPTSTSGQFIFVPSADSYVDASSPNTNNGSLTQLRIDNSPIVNSFLRFNIQGLSGTVTKATLRVYANSSSNAGYQVYSVPNTSWGETTITYSNAPPFGSLAGSMASFSGGVWTTVDITPFISGNGSVSLALTDNSSTAVSLASREIGANAPQLVITVGGSNATPTATASVTPTSTLAIPPTDTPTQAPTSTPTATNIPSSSTPTSTQVINPTDTPTQVLTSTPTSTQIIGPTNTPTQVLTSTPTATNIPSSPTPTQTK